MWIQVLIIAVQWLLLLVFLWPFDVNIVEFKLDDAHIIDLGVAGSCSLACKIDPAGPSVTLFNS
jgi:hypothetical protein